MPVAPLPDLDTLDAAALRDMVVKQQAQLSTRDEELERLHEKISSPRGKRIYALRKILVEPVFGQIKSAMGFRRFSLRGLKKAGDEWGIICTCHNLLKLFRARRPSLSPAT